MTSRGVAHPVFVAVALLMPALACTRQGEGSVGGAASAAPHAGRASSEREIVDTGDGLLLRADCEKLMPLVREVVETAAAKEAGPRNVKRVGRTDRGAEVEVEYRDAGDVHTRSDWSGTAWPSGQGCLVAIKQTTTKGAVTTRGWLRNSLAELEVVEKWKPGATARYLSAKEATRKRL